MPLSVCYKSLIPKPEYIEASVHVPLSVFCKHPGIRIGVIGSSRARATVCLLPITWQPYRGNWKLQGTCHCLFVAKTLVFESGQVEALGHGICVCLLPITCQPNRRNWRLQCTCHCLIVANAQVVDLWYRSFRTRTTVRFLQNPGTRVIVI